MNSSLILLDINNLLRSISLCLTHVISSHNTDAGEPSIFDLRASASIPLPAYLARLFKYMNCSSSVYVCALALMDKVTEAYPNLSLNQRNAHRMFLAAVVLSAKTVDDFYYKNSFYASVGGVTLAVMNQIQLTMLDLLGFDANISHQTFLVYLEKLWVYGEIQGRKQDEKKMNDHLEEKIKDDRTRSNSQQDEHRSSKEKDIKIEKKNDFSASSSIA